MDRFTPIAIVGTGCILPGAHSPQELWEAILSGDSLISAPPEGRFGIDAARQTAFGFTGGFVTGFAEDADSPHDTGTRWLIRAGEQAMAGASALGAVPERTAVILAQLGYPSRGLCDFAADVWEGKVAAHATRRFDSGGPAYALADAIGAGGPVFALDAACASSLYALKLACDRLQAGEVDLALACGLNAVDHLMLQQGFHALGAASPTGRSRPFMAGADGLVASEGAAAVALCRLSDVPDGMPVLGVIRGIGLSNDGARRGLLVPDDGGQFEAMQRAWAQAGLDAARDLQLLEAHATGTPLGDGVEVVSTARLLEEAQAPVRVTSLKSQTGHLITASGMAGLIKLTEALRHQTLPPMRADGAPIDALQGAPLKLQTEAEPWETHRPRLAGLSTFGFGGNNAHLVLGEDDGARPVAPVVPKEMNDIEIVGVGLRAGPDVGVPAVLARLSKGVAAIGASPDVALDPRKLRVPPRDLERATAQQAAVFEVVDEAFSGLDLTVERERVGCFVGFSCATESARWMWRERIAERLGKPAICAEADRMRDRVEAPLAAADVTGAMPNVSANRLNAAHDWRGQGFALLAETASGLVALDTALRALRLGELDVAVVAAADFAANDVHEAALAGRGVTQRSGDAAAALILTRPGLSGREPLARLSGVNVASRNAVADTPENAFAQCYGLAHAASGLAEFTSLVASGGWTFAGLGDGLDDMTDAERETVVTGGSLCWTPLKAVSKPPATRPEPSGPAPHRVLVSPHPAIPRQALVKATSCAMPEAPERAEVDWPVGFWSATATLAPPAPPTRSKPRQKPALPVRPPQPLDWRAPVGPKLSREELERAAFEPLSTVLGPEFAPQDGLERQVRMPRPPLLLCDRVTGIDAPPNVIGKGTLWSESDVTADHWAVFNGQMRLGPFVEAGQADLLLISWMGIDQLNQSERIYRLLGCELTFHGPLAEVGETLRYQIEITGHTELNGVRMFFIRYDCYAGERLILSVRNGQAGFFTDAELAASKGVLWDAATEDAPTAEPRLDKVSPSAKRAFGADDIDAFRAGDAYTCFGSGFERAAPQSRPPRLPGADLALFDEVETFEPTGGPWGRGYIRARQFVPTNAWFYDGHFHNDPCMPGTLMVEAAVQVMSFMMGALGMTLAADSHVFEPVAGEPSKFICRGQVIPDSDHEVIYEIFVDEIIMSPQPVLFATLLASSDGKKVFYCPRFGLKLVPRWPKLAGPIWPARQVGTSGDVRGDETALAEMASGAPSNALGSLYAHFNAGGRLPRLPSPPFHFVTRVVSVDGAPGQKEAGLTAIAEYDVPPEAWYFRDSGNGKMPLAVLTEIALQPCGWLAGFCGLALAGDSYFRNLDGKATVNAEIGPEAGTLSVSTKLTRISRAGPLTIVFYEVAVSDRSGAPVMSMETSFGFFTAEALAAQAGLKRNEDALSALNLPAMEVSLPEKSFGWPERRMGMIDRVDFWDAGGGEAGMGRIRARQTVDPRAWYFRAHFFSDPVQPGSLGLDALAQLAARAAALKGFGDRFRQPRLELLASGEAMSWTYRGQVTPEAKEVTTLIDILEVDEQADRTLITARGHLFVDGMRIYEMPRFTLALTPAEREPGTRRQFVAPADKWVGDHRPTRTVPALPLMAMAGMALRATSGRNDAQVTIEGFAPEAWATVPEAGLWLEATAGEDGSVGLTGDEGLETGDRRRILARGRWTNTAGAAPDAFTLPAPGESARDISDLYTSCDLFHGPAMQPVVSGRRDASGFEIVLDLSRAAVPGDPFDPVILDGLVHGVPHQSAEDWFALEGDWIIYPRLIRSLTIFGPLPETGHLTVRGAPLPGAKPPDLLPLRIEAFSERGCFAVMELVEKAFPKGRFAKLDPRERFAFIAGEPLSNMTPLTDHGNGVTRLKPADLMACDWLPGSAAAAYGAGDLTGTALVKSVLIREHFARAWDVHPARIAHDGVWAWTDGHPRTRYTLGFDRAARAWSVHHG